MRLVLQTLNSILKQVGLWEKLHDESDAFDKTGSSGIDWDVDNYQWSLQRKPLSRSENGFGWQVGAWICQLICWGEIGTNWGPNCSALKRLALQFII